MNISFVQLFSLLLSIISLIASIIWIKKRPFKWGWAVPIIVFMLHSIVFYLVIIFMRGEISSQNINWWSSLKNLHSYITFALYWVAKCYGIQLNGGKEK